MTPSTENVLHCLFDATTTSKDEIAADVWMLSASGGIAHHGFALGTPTTSCAVTGARAVQWQSMR